MKNCEVAELGTAVRAIQHIPDSVEELDLRCNEWLADLPSQWPDTQLRAGGAGKLHWINLCGCPAARTLACNLPAPALREIHDTGVTGWRFNRLRGGIQRLAQVQVVDDGADGGGVGLHRKAGEGRVQIVDLGHGAAF